MKLVYFGKKRPKVIATISPELYPDVKLNKEGITYISLTGKNLRYSFEPFKSIEVDEEVGLILLDKAGDIFKQVDVEDIKSDPKPIIKTDGYVGDMAADQIPDLKKQVERDLKEEEGKSVEQVIDEFHNKKKRGRPRKNEEEE